MLELEPPEWDKIEDLTSMEMVVFQDALLYHFKEGIFVTSTRASTPLSDFLWSPDGRFWKP